MALSQQEPQLYDLHFQNLVDQARKRIITYCPEWTDYNLSDPGITLIELFSWMTSMLGYRLNQVPRKNYIKFLELLGAYPEPPQQARTKLTFYLSTPFPVTGADGKLDYSTRTRIPIATEVATRRATSQDPEVIFTTDKTVELAPPRLIHVRRDIADSFSHNYLKAPESGEGGYDFHWKVKKEGFPGFNDEPQPDDAFYLGFAEDVSGYMLRLDMECQRGAGGTGIDGNNPPLVWESGMGEEQKDVSAEKQWQLAPAQSDSTQGLNQDGVIELRLPLDMQPTSVRGVKGFWLRCRVHQSDPAQGMYSTSPLIKNIKPFVLGVTTRAIHAALMPGVELGESNGDASQTVVVPSAPILPLDPDRDEFIEVQEERPNGSVAYMPWIQVDDFSQSSRYDRHFTLDLGSGEVSFGPSVRQPNGEVHQYGAIPPLRRKIRVTRYRTGGGTVGNVPRNSLRILKRSISYIVDVTNPEPALGGSDQESIEAATLRTRYNLQTQQRAVTAEDYERLAKGSKFNYLARLKCRAASPGQTEARPGIVTLLVVPKPRPEMELAEEEPEEMDAQQRQLLEQKQAFQVLARLAVDQSLKDQLRRDFETYRVLGINLNVNEPTYIGVKIEARIQCPLYSDPALVRQEVIEALKQFLTPVAIPDEAQPEGSQDSGGRPPGNGVPAGRPVAEEEAPWEWPFGQNLYISDIYTRLKTVEGVQHIIKVNLGWQTLSPEKAGHLADQFTKTKAPDMIWQKADGVIRIPNDALLHLLEHDIQVSRDEPH